MISKILEVLSSKLFPAPVMYGWNYNMDKAPDDRRILAICDHDADPYYDEASEQLTPYAKADDAFGHCYDGVHIIIWNEECLPSDPDWDYYDGVPSWWFLADDCLDRAANPIAWMPLPPVIKAAK